MPPLCFLRATFDCRCQLQVAELAGHWQWALRVTPFLGFVLLIVTAIFAVEPERGAVEREEREARENEAAAAATSSSSRPETATAGNSNALNDMGASNADAVESAPLTETPQSPAGATGGEVATAGGTIASIRVIALLWLADIVMLIKTCVTSSCRCPYSSLQIRFEERMVF